MDYSEAIEAEVSKAEAIREIELHGLPVGEFFLEVGERETYKGSEVLFWLGY